MRILEDNTTICEDNEAWHKLAVLFIGIKVKNKDVAQANTVKKCTNRFPEWKKIIKGTFSCHTQKMKTLDCF